MALKPKQESRWDRESHASIREQISAAMKKPGEFVRVHPTSVVDKVNNCAIGYIKEELGAYIRDQWTGHTDFKDYYNNNSTIISVVMKHRCGEIISAQQAMHRGDNVEAIGGKLGKQIVDGITRHQLECKHKPKTHVPGEFKKFDPSTIIREAVIPEKVEPVDEEKYPEWI